MNCTTNISTTRHSRGDGNPVQFKNRLLMSCFISLDSRLRENDRIGMSGGQSRIDVGYPCLR
jgi:hypothetical protein